MKLRLGILNATIALGLAAVLALSSCQTIKGKWQQIANKKNCTVWNLNPQQNETVTWVGSCKNGKVNGSGVAKWRYLKNGKLMKSSYIGAMQDGRRNGNGVSNYSDGSRYVGDLKDGKPNGVGIYTNKDGKIFAGDWSNGCFKKGGRVAVVNTTMEKCDFK